MGICEVAEPSEGCGGTVKTRTRWQIGLMDVESKAWGLQCSPVLLGHSSNKESLKTQGRDREQDTVCESMLRLESK